MRRAHCIRPTLAPAQARVGLLFRSLLLPHLKSPPPPEAQPVWALAPERDVTSQLPTLAELQQELKSSNMPPFQHGSCAGASSAEFGKYLRKRVCVCIACVRGVCVFVRAYAHARVCRSVGCGCVFGNETHLMSGDLHCVLARARANFERICGSHEWQKADQRLWSQDAERKRLEGIYLHGVEVKKAQDFEERRQTRKAEEVRPAQPSRPHCHPPPLLSALGAGRRSFCFLW